MYAIWSEGELGKEGKLGKSESWVCRCFELLACAGLPQALLPQMFDV
jgi:hypothetical protein